MIKKLATVVVLVTLSGLSFADDSSDFPMISVGQFSVKNIVKAKLWYEGVEISQTEKSELDQLTQEQMPEELVVALEKF